MTYPTAEQAEAHRISSHPSTDRDFLKQIAGNTAKTARNAEIVMLIVVAWAILSLIGAIVFWVSMDTDSTSTSTGF